MKVLLLGLFTLILVCVWIFFVIANIHAKKFKNFSSNLNKVTNFLFFFLLTLSILWYVLIIFWNISEKNFFNLFDKDVKIENQDFFDNTTY